MDYRRVLAAAFAGVLFTGSAALGGAAAAPSAIPASDDTGEVYKKLSTQVGPSLVTVKFVLKVEAGGQMSEFMGGMGDEGMDTEVTGLMIEPGGLVLASNTKMGGYFGMMGRFGGGGNITTNPTDLKVLVGEDTEGLKAKLIARDTELDLAWIQIEDPAASGKTFTHVDLTASAEPAIGDRLFVVERLGKFFDHALVVAEGRLGGKTSKPRPLFVPSAVGMDLGMPMFTADGKLIGIGVSQVPSREDVEGGDMGSLMGDGYYGSMVLPAAEVVKATKRSKELGAKGEEKKPEGGEAAK